MNYLNKILKPGSKRVVNLSAGCAAIPIEVLERAQKEFLTPLGSQISATEMGYRTSNFHKIMDDAEESFRKYNHIPDNYEVHFFNGGATLQFAALPMNLLGSKGGKCSYLMSGHWSEKSVKEAKMYCNDVVELNVDPKGLYFDYPEPEDWNIPNDSTYVHYTSADTRQGFEYQQFGYEAIPKDVILTCDASANYGSKPWDVTKYGVIYAAAHKNFSTSGVCYTIIRKDLINEDVHPHTPTMCNWSVFQNAPNKIWNVPVIFSIWLGHLMCEHMIAQGGVEYYEDLAKRRSRLLYDLVDESEGFYRTFVTDERYRSRMNLSFTIGSGEGKHGELVEKFLGETAQMGWLDVRSHPLGISSDAIRVTMYNHQPIEVVTEIRDYMNTFMIQNKDKL